jgi:hypothetical protein
MLSAVVYAAHIAYERFRMNSAPRRAALRGTGAVAVRRLGLGISALFHSPSINASQRHTRLLLIALVAWPILVGVPALGASEVLVRFQARVNPSRSDFGLVATKKTRQIHLDTYSVNPFLGS